MKSANRTSIMSVKQAPELTGAAVVLQLVHGIERTLERHFWRWTALAVTMLLLSMIVIDLRKKLWIDELVTVYMAKQGGPVEIVRATAEGVDVSPPLYPILVQALLPLVGSEALAARLPSTVGLCLMLVGVLAVSRRWFGVVGAWVPSLLAFDSLQSAGNEGRCYGLVLGCSAVSLFCWQTASAGRRRTASVLLLAATLALMSALHYYSIFFAIPLFLGELVRWRKSGKLDIAILAALATMLLVLAVHYPLIEANRRYSVSYWSPANWGQIRSFYELYFLPMLSVGAVLALIVRLIVPSQPSYHSEAPVMPVHEWVAIGAIALMPAFAVTVSKYTTHVFVDRYTLWAMIGFAILVGASLHIVTRRQVIVAACISGALAAVLGVHMMRSAFRETPVLPEGESVMRALTQLRDGSEPIVVPNSHVFMELAYYGDPRWRERLVYPLAQDLELRYTGTDNTSFLMSSLRRRAAPLHVVDYKTLLATSPRFVLAVRPSDYMASHLVAEGYRVTLISATADSVLFEVEAARSN
jgi:mannosyltransferase